MRSCMEMEKATKNIALILNQIKDNENVECLINLLLDLNQIYEIRKTVMCLIHVTGFNFR